MAIHTSIDEHLEEKSSSLFFYGKPFKDEASGSLESDESQDGGPEINLNYSIETGLEEHLTLQKKKKNNKLSSACSKIIDPRRRKVNLIVTSIVLLGFILIVAISATVSNKKMQNKSSSISAASSIQDERDGVTSRGEGGGAGNGYFPTQNIGVYPNNDEPLPPFSVLDPVQDLERYGYDRPTSSSPNARLDPLREQSKGRRALPTNSWYQNMLRLDVDQDPTKNHRVYTVPYILDAAGDFPGLRAHSTRLDATPSQVILQIDEPYALTLGARTDTIKENNNNAAAALLLDKGYSVHEATELGLTLHWGSYMKSTLTRGAPYVTMIYNMADPPATSMGLLPTMHWELDTSELPIVDGTRTVDCQSEPVFTVEREIELAFHNSGQRWLVFFSRPVQLQCNNEQGSPTILQVLKDDDDYDENPLLVVRGAVIVSSFSTGDDDEVFSESYANQLRAHATVYPGQSTAVTQSFDEENNQARISFNWDPQSMNIRNVNGVDQMISRSSVDGSGSDAGNDMIMFALPHHQEILSGDTNTVMPNLCTISLLGPVCLTTGSVWNMYEDLPTVGLQAPRHPDPKYVPVLAEALLEDIRYQIPDNFQRGAADTYFSGKTIARLARILLITEELKDLCEDISNNREYEEACDGLELPSNNEIDDALNQLRETVTVWTYEEDPPIEIFDNESDDYNTGDGDEDEEEESRSNDNNIFDEGATEDVVGLLTCSNPTECTSQILNNMARGHSCGDRILYLMDVLSKTEVDACRQVAVDEYPEECGFCRPDV
ncbi:hypothetical protein FRACYDRAFT_264429 [Fragilariopsis cylindrus CCMP1102]|uniref:Uncharacterized protein n=1 Tax=Fragilariopsis cylindrus CCMP1102 TaxID=635003 RepID=A0A1E7ES35_9STRA|nr:hypothetical protein FRACYDRAFT_264429 [Fragilariopsis cylindrus CCMP1102]|eukprot:OEU08818.1 hypothetical protein FRACYDRAFT_264429 [Fragilariopsis cylindrus CCMP1102]